MKYNSNQGTANKIEQHTEKQKKIKDQQTIMNNALNNNSNQETTNGNEQHIEQEQQQELSKKNKQQ